MVLNHHAHVSTDKFLRQFSGDQTAPLFFRSCALKQNAWLIDDQPIILRALGAEPGSVISLLAAPDKTPIACDSLGPDHRIAAVASFCMQLLLVTIPDKRPGRNAITVVAKAMRHRTEPTGQRDLFGGSR